MIKQRSFEILEKNSNFDMKKDQIMLIKQNK